MNFLKAIYKSVIVFLVAAVFSFVLLENVGDGLLKENQAKESNQEGKQQLHYINLVAIGDSLTQGVGDPTQRGGYVPLLAQNLKQNEHIRSVQTENFGKSGDETNEIIQRIQESDEIKAALQDASIVSVTAGGNDLIKYIRQSGLRVDWEQEAEHREAFEKDLHQLLDLIRTHQADAELFVFGIYNPYENGLKDIEYLQSLVSNWNHTIEEITSEYDQVHFIPLDHLFDSEQAIVSGEETEEAELSHPYLYEEDYFHPNAHGYALMADEITKEILSVLD